MDALQPHAHLHRARLRVLAALILALVRFRTTGRAYARPLARLCLAMPGTAHESRDPARLYGLLVAHAPVGPLTLSLDRTEWKTAGHTHGRAYARPLLVVGYLHHGVVVPLMWHALGKRGSSSQAERIALFKALFALLPAERIEAVLGDREFIGKDFLNWLDVRRVGFVVRIKKDAWITHVRSGTAYQAGPLFALLPDGGRRRLRGKWTVYGTACFVTAVRERGSTWMRMSNRHPNTARVLYEQRWAIADGTSAQTLFGVLKSRGFDLEATHLAVAARIERLFGVLAVALVWVLGVAVQCVAERPDRRRRMAGWRGRSSASASTD